MERTWGSCQLYPPWIGSCIHPGGWVHERWLYLPLACSIHLCPLLGAPCSIKYTNYLLLVNDNDCGGWMHRLLRFLWLFIEKQWDLKVEMMTFRTSLQILLSLSSLPLSDELCLTLIENSLRLYLGTYLLRTCQFSSFLLLLNEFLSIIIVRFQPIPGCQLKSWTWVVKNVACFFKFMFLKPVILWKNLLN